MDGHCLVLITCGDPGEARGIARHLVESRLAAGVQLIPIESIYTWGGDVVEDNEWLLVAKTRAELFEPIRTSVADLHSYDVPPVLMLQMTAASKPYLDWIDRSVESMP